MQDSYSDMNLQQNIKIHQPRWEVWNQSWADGYKLCIIKKISLYIERLVVFVDKNYEIIFPDISSFCSWLMKVA